MTYLRQTQIIGLLSLISIAACKKPEMTRFDLVYTTEISVSENMDVGAAINIVSDDILTNATAYFASNGTQSDLVYEIFLTSMEMNVLSPSDGSLSALDSLNVFLTSSGSAAMKVAWKDPVPLSTDTWLPLDVWGGTNFMKHIKTEKFRLRTTGLLREQIQHPLVIQIRVVFNVNAEQVAD